MTKRKFADAEVIGALKHLEAGRNPADSGREMGVSKHTVYACEASFGGLEVNQARRLRQLEEETSLSSLCYQTPAEFAGQLAASSDSVRSAGLRRTTQPSERGPMSYDSHCEFGGGSIATVPSASLAPASSVVRFIVNYGSETAEEAVAFTLQ